MSGQLPPLIEALREPRCYDHAVERIEIIETHISWVLLTGEYVYKIKKPVNLGFLDFTTLAQRRFFCQEELRLNRRLAPQLYLDVIPITGSPQNPRLNGAGDAIEYAVKMRQFPQDAQLDRVLARGALQTAHVDALAHTLAEFHAQAAVAPPTSPFGDPERVYAPMVENFRHIRPLITDDDAHQLEQLENWTARTYAAQRARLAGRKRDGYVRECHGDLHLANMALLGTDIVVFDCLEFNESLRWIDVANEIAFLVMDLDDRGRADFGRRCLNAYLEYTGDYPGVALLRFYQVYRALVRAKVACIRLGQGDLGKSEAEEMRRLYRSYMRLASRYTEPGTSPLIICHGLSGSGKTWIAQQLLEALDAVRVRSDIERKRLHGLAPEARSRSSLEGGIYTAQATEATYAHMARLAREVIAGGLPVILDAAFLKRAQRERMRALAGESRVPFVILDVRAPLSVLRDRVRARDRAARDASEAGIAVLERQLATSEPLAADEEAMAIAVDGSAPPAAGALWQCIKLKK